MNNLLTLRKRKGVTQQAVADALGVTASQYGMMEKSKRNITQENLVILCDYFGVSSDYLLGLVPDSSESEQLIDVPPEFHKVPIVGSVACSWDKGFIEEFDGDYLFINDYLYNKYGDLPRATVARGNSMKDMISPGDLLIVVPPTDVENNDIVIATIGDDELTAKKFHYNNVGGFDLIPVNPAYGIQSFTESDIKKLPVSVVARVIEIRKGLRV